MAEKNDNKANTNDQSNETAHEVADAKADANADAAGGRKDLGVRQIAQVDRTTLGIEWNDGVRQRWKLAELRRACPCASCVDEWTRERLLDPETIPADLVAKRVESVGRYALRVTFADGHDTGIYTFSMLRELADKRAK
jgi:DUF971 family protein